MPGLIRRLYKSSPRLHRLERRIKSSALASAARLGLWLGGRLTLQHALRAAELLGGALYRTLGEPRRLADEHLRLAFGDALTATEREYLARASFVNIARCFIELVKIDEIRAQIDDYLEAEGRAHVDALLAPGKGAIVVTGHVGNWELLASYWAWQGTRVAAVARRIYVSEINQMLVDFRARQGVETILRESPRSARQILGALKSNSILAMLIDQDTDAPSVSVPPGAHAAGGGGSGSSPGLAGGGGLHSAPPPGRSPDCRSAAVCDPAQRRFGGRHPRPDAPVQRRSGSANTQQSGGMGVVAPPLAARAAAPP